MNKVLGFFGTVFIAFFLFSAGQDATLHHYSTMTLELIEAAFFLAMGLVFVSMVWNESIEAALNHSHRAQAEELAQELVSSMDKAFAEAEASANAQTAVNQAATAVVPRKVQIPVVDGDKPAKKPRMTAKRKAAIQAEEAAANRDQKNAKRRAARAAKKNQ